MDLKVRGTSEYKTISSDETLKSLETSTEGLSESEAGNRLEVFGYNEIKEEKRNLLS